MLLRRYHEVEKAEPVKDVPVSVKTEIKPAENIKETPVKAEPKKVETKKINKKK